MNGSTEVVDAALLQSLLSKHRAHLANTHREVGELKSFIVTLEGTIGKLNHEINTLKLELSHYKESEANLVLQLERAAKANEKLLSSIEKQAQDNAHAITNVESKMRSLEAEWRLRYERVCSQLEATQQPTSTTQPLPWRYVMDNAAHPAHILRDAVLDDQKREERITLKNLPIIAGDNAYMGGDTLRRLRDAAHSDDTDTGTDIRMWRLVLKRIYTVLTERRAIRGLDDNCNTDFAVRGRNAFVGEWVQLHKNIGKALKAIQSTRGLLSTKSLPNSIQLERYIDLAVSILADIDTQCYRVEHSLFTDVDKALYKLDSK